MQKYLHQFINQFSMFYLIGLSYEDTTETVYVLDVLYRKGELSIVKKRHFNSLAELKVEDLKQHYPVLIHIDGDNVITKKVEKTNGYKNNLIFNSNIDDFFFYEYDADAFMLVSMIRNQTIIDIKNTLKKLDKYIVHLTAGPFVLANLVPFIASQATLSSQYYEINFKDKRIESFKKTVSNNGMYNIDGDTISQQETALVATLVDYISKDSRINYDLNIILDHKEQQKFKILSKIAATATIVLVLSILMISHFTLKQSSGRLVEKESELAISQQTLNQLEALKEEQLLKEKILANSGVIHKDYFTKYFSDISNIVPKSIVLDEVAVKPIEKKIKPIEKIKFSLNEIQISGYTFNDKSFIGWTKDLSRLDWVKKVEISNYEDNTKKKNSFVINIEI